MDDLAPDNGPKGDRVWTDGCYDMVHYGHANQLRQSKQFGNKLVVGVHNDEEITLHKGPPVFNQEERKRMVLAIKWVDDVVENAPYSTTIETLNKYNCDFCLHGDDITLTADGHDTYEEVKKAGRYREIKRTAGVSTTDLVGRMLLLTRNHHESEDNMEKDFEMAERIRTLSTNSDSQSPWTRVSRYMGSNNAMCQFAQGNGGAKPGEKVVYVCGAFDLFHVGHLSFLEEAKKHGDYLIVGILGDLMVNEYKGANHPIMSLHERVLSVLAYKPVNEILFGVPYEVTDEFINQHKISVVCHGISVPHHERPGCEPFADPKRRGIYVEVESGSDITTEKIIERIINHRLEYEARNKKKENKERAVKELLKSMNCDTTKAVNLSE